MQTARSAYVHVPFCHHRCGYCNFTLIAGRDDLVSAYLTALENELRGVLSHPHEVDTLYLGGGTPSHLEPEQLKQLLEILHFWLPTLDAEVSCEVNPQDCTPEKLETLIDGGVNRLSLGGQSFSDRKLKMLEREHSGSQLKQAISLCSDYTNNLSLDLIFAAPKESLKEWRDDLMYAQSSAISHLSTYGLTIEKGAAFYGRVARGQLSELDPDLQATMFEEAIDELAAAGWEHYEVSSFTRGARCQHNECYWLGNPWWAFGPGAASFLPTGEAAAPFVRQVNHRSVTTYIRRQREEGSAIAERDFISAEQLVRERLVFGLRRLQGVNLDELADSWGDSIRELFEPQLARFIDQGWLQLSSAQQLKLTRRGLMISDSLWPELLE